MVDPDQHQAFIEILYREPGTYQTIYHEDHQILEVTQPIRVH